MDSRVLCHSVKSNVPGKRNKNEYFRQVTLCEVHDELEKYWSYLQLNSVKPRSEPCPLEIDSVLPFCHYCFPSFFIWTLVQILCLYLTLNLAWPKKTLTLYKVCRWGNKMLSKSKHQRVIRAVVKESLETDGQAEREVYAAVTLNLCHFGPGWSSQWSSHPSPHNWWVRVWLLEPDCLRLCSHSGLWLHKLG